jgi:hypothetical protein
VTTYFVTLSTYDRLFGGSRDCWVYQIDIDEMIKLLDLHVVDDKVTLKHISISGGGTNAIELAELKNTIGAR